MNAHGHSIVVLSRIGRKTDFDWCGSLSGALKRRAERIASGEYDLVCIRRVRLTKTRRPGSKCWQYSTGPMMTWQRRAIVSLPKAA